MNFSVDQLNLFTLHVGCCHHYGDWNWKNVRSPFSCLYYVTEGTAQVEMPSGRITLRPGYLYFIPAFTTHSDICDSLFVHYYIHIYEEQKDGMYILDELDMPVEVKAESGDLELLKRLCYLNPFLKLTDTNPDAYNNHQALVNNLEMTQRRTFSDKVESHGILYILMSRFLKHAKPKVEVKDNRIYQTLTFIRKNLDSPLDINKLAENACMSKDHFIRIFKRETGETPNMFVTLRKMEKAELMLITTDQQVKTIATSLGYDDQSYFNRLFKKNTGITPQQYREKHFK